MSFHNISFACILVALFLFVSISFAWDWDTHRQLARDLLLKDYSGCASQIDAGAVAPDKDFKDFTNHHCYSLGCPADDKSFCPKNTNSCPALTQAAIWLARAKNETATCTKAYDFSVATHYTADAFDPMHQITGEDYDKCHAVYEDKIGTAVKKGKPFNISVICETPSQMFSFSQADFVQLERDVAKNLTLTAPLPLTPGTQPANASVAIATASSQYSAASSQANATDDSPSRTPVSPNVASQPNDTVIFAIVGLALFIFIFLVAIFMFVWLFVLGKKKK